MQFERLSSNFKKIFDLINTSWYKEENDFEKFITPTFLRIYERRFPEGADTKASKGFWISLEAFVFLNHSKAGAESRGLKNSCFL